MERKLPKKRWNSLYLKEKSKLLKIEDIKQGFVEVVVEYYDQNEKNNLQKYSSANAIESTLASRLKIPIPEFLTYYLFHRKRPSLTNLANYQQLSQNIYRSLNDLEDFIEFNGTSIIKPLNAGTQIEHITEHIGESIGLSLINRIHTLTEADWDKIPESHGRNAVRTFDYQIAASDGRNIIQLEAKGSSVDDNRNKTAPIYTHKENIVSKKKDIIEKGKKYPYPASIRYGTITAVDSRKNGAVKCWLLDPDSQEISKGPKRFRLLSRMHFLYDWISFLGPQSQLATALSNRITDLETIQNPFELDGKPLLNSNNEPFYFRPFDYSRRHASWFTNKSKVTDGPAGGIIFQLSKNTLFFLGIFENLLSLAADQDFEKILEYKHKYPGSILKNVECVINKNRFHEFDIPGTLLNKENNKLRRIHFELKGQLHYSQEGIVFGLLPLNTHSIG